MSRFACIPEHAIRCRELLATDWRVLACIALHADATGRAYPSMATIADVTGIRRQDVPRVIRRLERLVGLARERGVGRGNRNVYVLWPGKPAASVRMGADNSVGNVRMAADRNVRTQPTEMSAHRRREHTKEQTNVYESAETGVAGDWFESFWRVYPDRGDHTKPKKPAKEKFLAAVKDGVDPEAIIRGADHYRRVMSRHQGDERRYVKQPANWLNQRLWEQYQAEPAAAQPKFGGML